MESSLHRSMKTRASKELEMEGYRVIYEPATPPSSFLEWERYRPDLLGVRVGEGVQDYALVECETRPSARRLASKNFRSVEAQAMLDCSFSLRRVLVVPRGSLRRLDQGVRRLWEVWVYGAGGFDMFPAVSS